MKRLLANVKDNWRYFAIGYFVVGVALEIARHCH